MTEKAVYLTDGRYYSDKDDDRDSPDSISWNIVNGIETLSVPAASDSEY